MTDKEILYKAIVKAKKNGWVVDFPIKDIKEILTYNSHITPAIYYWIIFEHDFAKAVWGEEVIDFKSWDCYRPRSLKRYEFYLQQMVLEKEPLKYLEKFL